MSTSAFCTTLFCVSLVLVSLVLAAGCTTTPSGPGETITVTPSPPTPVPTPAPEQAAAVQLKGNIYALSSDQHLGIDTIRFAISPSLQAQVIDLTRLEIVFSTPETDPVTLSWSTRETTGTFTTTMGNNPVTVVSPGEEVDISFRVKPVPGDTPVSIELIPPVGAPLPLSGTVPAVISSMTILS